MKFGFNVPVHGPGAEAAGYDFIAVTDHIAVPRKIESRYPYSADGSWPRRAGDYLEPLSLMGFLAGATSRLKLLTSILVVPYRPPVLTAKMIATLDVMSAGRVILGVGTGWMAEEFEALDAPDFADRGKVTNEYLEAFRALWTEDYASYHGDHANFDELICAPKPVQPGGPRIWAGGEGKAAMRRVARYADGWYPVGNNPQAPLDTITRYTEAQARLKQLVTAADRDPDTLDYAYWAVWRWTGEPVATTDGGRQLITGTAQNVIDDVKHLADLGVGHLSLLVLGASLQDTMDNIDRFADQVISRI